MAMDCKVLLENVSLKIVFQPDYHMNMKCM